MMTDMLYWPLIDVLSWGLASQWLVQSNPEHSSLVVSTIVALVVWNVVWRSQSEVGRNMLDEIWNKNLLNIFSTPLTLLEWVTSVLLQSIAKTIITGGMVALAILALYSVNVLVLGWWLLPFLLLMTMTGWATGFVAASVIVRWGQKMQTMVWVLPGMLIPLSGVYYPAAQLPPVLREISVAVPSAYVFDAMRQVVSTGAADVSLLVTSACLNVLYLTLSILLFVRMFKKSKALNLGRLHN